MGRDRWKDRKIRYSQAHICMLTHTYLYIYICIHTHIKMISRVRGELEEANPWSLAS